MANRVAWLTKRVKIGGQWFVRKPIIKTSGFVTEKVEHNGQSLHAPGTFVLEWYEAGKRQRKPLSSVRSAWVSTDTVAVPSKTLCSSAAIERWPVMASMYWVFSTRTITEVSTRLEARTSWLICLAR
jgi:hypothetical protein